MIGLLTTGRHDLSYLKPLDEALRAAGSETVWLDSPPGMRQIKDADHAILLATETMNRMPWQCRLSGVSRAVALGDRSETLAACVALTIARIPIAHIHGGDVTLGAIDDVCRNAISQLADMHFAATPEAARNLRRMNVPGEIHMTGSPAIDLMMRKKRERIPGNDIVFAYHPETLSSMPVQQQIEYAVDIALQHLPEGGKVICVGANPDAGGKQINDYLRSLGDPFVMQSGGSEWYWDTLATCRALVGNSSSGVIECPALGVPFVEIGERQKGRWRGSYGDGRATERIVAALRTDEQKRQAPRG